MGFLILLRDVFSPKHSSHSSYGDGLSPVATNAPKQKRKLATKPYIAKPIRIQSMSCHPDEANFVGSPPLPSPRSSAVNQEAT